MIPTEYEEQVAFVKWLELRGYTFTAIPNSTYTTSYNQKRRNHAMGLRAGLPDLLVIANDRLVFVEMKRIKGSVTSKEQKQWIEKLNNINIPARVCKGAHEAIKFIQEI